MDKLQLQYDYSQPEWYEFIENVPSDVRVTKVWDICRYICPHNQRADTSILKCEVCGESATGKVSVSKQWRIDTRDGGEAIFIDDYSDKIIRLCMSYKVDAFCVHRERDHYNPDVCAYCSCSVSSLQCKRDYWE